MHLLTPNTYTLLPLRVWLFCWHSTCIGKDTFWTSKLNTSNLLRVNIASHRPKPWCTIVRLATIKIASYYRMSCLVVHVGAMFKIGGDHSPSEVVLCLTLCLICFPHMEHSTHPWNFAFLFSAAWSVRRRGGDSGLSMLRHVVWARGQASPSFLWDLE